MIKKFLKWLGEPMVYETRLGFIIYFVIIIIIIRIINKFL